MISRDLLEHSEMQTREPKVWGGRENSEGRLNASTSQEEFPWRDHR